MSEKTRLPMPSLTHLRSKKKLASISKMEQLIGMSWQTKVQFTIIDETVPHRFEKSELRNKGLVCASNNKRMCAFMFTLEGSSCWVRV